MDNYSRKNIKKSQQVFLPIGLVVIALLIGGLLFLNRKSTRDCCTYYLSDLLHISLIISIFVLCLKAF